MQPASSSAPSPPYSSGIVHGVEAGLDQRLARLDGVAGLLVDLGGVRRDLLLRQRAHGLAERLVLVAEPVGVEVRRSWPLTLNGTACRHSHSSRCYPCRADDVATARRGRSAEGRAEVRRDLVAAAVDAVHRARLRRDHRRRHRAGRGRRPAHVLPLLPRPRRTRSPPTTRRRWRGSPRCFAAAHPDEPTAQRSCCAPARRSSSSTSTTRSCRVHALRADPPGARAARPRVGERRPLPAAVHPAAAGTVADGARRRPARRGHRGGVVAAHNLALRDVAGRGATADGQGAPLDGSGRRRATCCRVTVAAERTGDARRGPSTTARTGRRPPASGSATARTGPSAGHA